MARDYDVFFRFDEPFDIVVEADSPEGAVEAFYGLFSDDELISRLAEQGFQGAGIEAFKVVDCETGEEHGAD